MAIRTQIRLPQITGSLGTGASQVNDQVNSGASVASGSADISDLAGTLSYMAAAIKRVHGADSFTESNAGVFHQNLQFDATNASDPTITANATNAPLKLISNGTGGTILGGTTDNRRLRIDTTTINEVAIRPVADTADVVLGTSTAGSLTEIARIDGSAESLLMATNKKIEFRDADIHISSDADGELNVEANSIVNIAIAGTDELSIDGTDATFGTNIIIPDGATIGSATDADAMSISSAGVVSISATTANTNATDGALTVAGGVGVALDLSVGGGELRLTADSSNIFMGADEDVVISHNGSTGLDIVSDGAATLFSGATLSLSGSTGESIGKSGQTSTFNGNIVVAGNLDVNGTTTTIDTTNSSITDGLIVLNSGSDANPADRDAGIIFAQPDVSRAIFVDQDDARKFKFVTTYTSGSETSVTQEALADVDMGSLSASGVTNSALTSGRVVLAGTSGVLEDDADLLWNNSTNALTLGAANAFTLTHQNSNNQATISQGHRLGFTDANKYITADANDLSVLSNNAVIIDANEAIVLDSNGGSGNGEIILKDGGTERGKIVLEATGKNELMLTGSAAFNVVLGAPEYTSFHIAENEMAKVMTVSGLGTVLSSSNANNLTLDSSTGLIAFAYDDTVGSLGHVDLTDTNEVTFGHFDGNAGKATTGYLKLKKNGEPHVMSGSDLFVVKGAGAAGRIRLATDNADETSANFLGLAAPTGMTSAQTYVFPASPTNGYVLSTDAGGTLSWVALGGAANSSKLINEVTASLTAGDRLSDSVSASDFDFSAVSDSSAPNAIDIFVNGQLLQSSSVAYSSLAGSSPGDNAIDGTTSTADVKFTFDLEADDTVTVIVRA
jgi:hypothetical protein